MFALKQKFKDEGNDLMQGLVKLLMNTFYAIQNRRDFIESLKCIIEHQMLTVYDDNVLECWKLSNGNYEVKFRKHDGLDGDDDVKNT